MCVRRQPTTFLFICLKCSFLYDFFCLHYRRALFFCSGVKYYKEKHIFSYVSYKIFIRAIYLMPTHNIAESFIYKLFSVSWKDTREVGCYKVLVSPLSYISKGQSVL